MTVAILHFPDEYPAWLGRILPERFFRLLCRASRFKRNPRSESHMCELLREHDGTEVRVMKALRFDEIPADAIQRAEEIVLLWPDGNGYGWARLERHVFRLRSPSARVTVLNGRRRTFSLTRRSRRGYLLRRWVERLWLGELAFTLVFLVVTPVLVGWDLVRGKT